MQAYLHMPMKVYVLQEWAANNKVPMLQQQVKPQAAINTTTLYKTEEEVVIAPTNILQVIFPVARCALLRLDHRTGCT